MNDNDCTKNPPRRIYVNALILHVIVTIYIGHILLTEGGRHLTHPLPHPDEPIGASAITIMVFVGIVLGSWVAWATLKNPVYLPMLCLLDQTLDVIWRLVKGRDVDK